jgi:prevent-host-death family protein
MKLNEDIKPVSYLKAHTADMLLQVNETQRPIFVTQHGEAKAVLIDAQSYESMRKAIGLLKLLAQGEADVRAGRLIDQAKMFAEMDKQWGRPVLQKA